MGTAVTVHTKRSHAHKDVTPPLAAQPPKKIAQSVIQDSTVQTRVHPNPVVHVMRVTIVRKVPNHHDSLRLTLVSMRSKGLPNRCHVLSVCNETLFYNFS